MRLMGYNGTIFWFGRGDRLYDKGSLHVGWQLPEISIDNGRLHVELPTIFEFGIGRWGIGGEITVLGFGLELSLFVPWFKS